MDEDAPMRTAVLALFWGFTAYAFVVRSGLQKIATGDTGLRGVARDRGPLALAAGLVVFPAWLAVGLAPLAASPRPVAAGLPVAVAGIGVALWAQRTMGRAWRIGVAAGERTALVTSGPFRWVRNPFFTGMSLVAAGTTASLPTWLGAGATLLLVAAVAVQVRLVEEPHLASAFGPDYLAYAGRTGRFLPRPGRRR
jgi:protein-S-isoprenylcysteine O-methyltransferase Ste14